MKQILAIALVLIVAAGTVLVLTSNRSNVSTSSALNERQLVRAHEMSQIYEAFDDMPFSPPFNNHRYIELDDGTLMFVHFDSAIGSESGLLYVGAAVPGVFCDSDQERVNERFGGGFTHFHTTITPGATEASAGHGGEPNAEGYWFRHIAVDEFDRPWGRVTPGIDHNFMPTPPPSC